MVNTSNWPALVAMSVVTRWRSTFSSSTTQRRWMSLCSCSNCDDSFCITTMSPLFTVAMVIVESARAVPAASPTVANTAIAARKPLVC